MRLDRDAVLRTETRVPLTLEDGTGINEGEVDVEEDGTDGWRHLPKPTLRSVATPPTRTSAAVRVTEPSAVNIEQRL